MTTYPVNDPDVIRSIITGNPRIAMLGLSPKEERDSNRVAKYLLSQGIEVVPVNPVVDTILGQKSYPDLKSIPGTIDVVDVFRKPDAVPAIVDEVVELGIKNLWLQLGVVDKESAEKASQAGVRVVMDKCIKVEHRLYFA